MPTSKRGAIKRRNAAILNGLGKAQAFALELKELYQEHHPDYAEGYENIATMIEQVTLFVKKMRGFI